MTTLHLKQEDFDENLPYAVATRVDDEIVSEDDDEDLPLPLEESLTNFAAYDDADRLAAAEAEVMAATEEVAAEVAQACANELVMAEEAAAQAAAIATIDQDAVSAAAAAAAAVDVERETSTMIAEAAAAAVEAAAGDVVDVDVTAVANAAALAVEEAAKAAEAAALSGLTAEKTLHGSFAATEATAKKNEQRRKRYREKTVEAEARDAGSVSASTTSSKKSKANHGDQLAARRRKDRQRYANMSPEQRQLYNAKRREQYHRQTEASRHKRRERERNRYHALTDEAAKDRNARRAKLERERYQRLTPEELEAKNRRRRERAANSRSKNGDSVSGSLSSRSFDRNHSQSPVSQAVTVNSKGSQPAVSGVPSSMANMGTLSASSHIDMMDAVTPEMSVGHLATSIAESDIKAEV